MENQFKLAVLGNKNTILIFQTLGCEVFEVKNETEAQAKVKTLFTTYKTEVEKKTPEYAVIFVEEDYYKTFPEDLIEKFTKNPLPAVISIPQVSQDKKSFANDRLRKIVEKAVGSNILG